MKSNDQLININGFSLLGKSNEEAMQILREAMQVETMPGYIQLTISRKRKHISSNALEKPTEAHKIINKDEFEQYRQNNDYLKDYQDLQNDDISNNNISSKLYSVEHPVVREKGEQIEFNILGK